jgi:SWI/SNF-related matrix-associated actin-dependent regulator of chromatin subfamily A-like protein 1
VELFPYQEEAVIWLSQKRFALLALSMGLGKSAVAIRAAERIGAKSILVICRAVAIANWKNEFLKFSSTPFELSVTSYESLHKVPERQWDLLIVDESHYLKEPYAKRTQRVLGQSGAVHRAKRTWLLSGTPTPNHVGELWTTLYTAGRTKYSYAQFIERFCTTRVTGFGIQITGTNIARVKEIKELLGPIFLKRTAEEVNLELPQIFYQDVVVPKGPVSLHYSRTFIPYLTFPKRMPELVELLAKQYGIIAKITGGKFDEETFEAIKAQAKSISTLRQYVGLQKVAPVIELVTSELEANAYKKIVLFCHHRAVVEGLRLGLKRFGAVTMYGGTPPEKKDMQMAKFQTQAKCRVMVATISTAGTSINLTAANQVMFVEQTYVPADMDQAAKRCHRIGQTEPVQVRFVSVDDGVETHINRILKRKTAELAGIYSEPTRDIDLTIKHQPENINELV